MLTSRLAARFLLALLVHSQASAKAFALHP